MKKLIILFLIYAFCASCSKKEAAKPVGSTYDYAAKLPYDTTAIDSFAPGATSNNVILKRVAVDTVSDSKLSASDELLLLEQKKVKEEKEKAEAARKKTAEKTRLEETKKTKAPQKAAAEAVQPKPAETTEQ